MVAMRAARVLGEVMLYFSKAAVRAGAAVLASAHSER